jgi:TolA-binding protein
MKTQSNSMLIGRLHKQISDMQLKLEEKRGLYQTALRDDKRFEETKDLYTEIKQLRRSLKHLEAHVIISNYLAEHSN